MASDVVVAVSLASASESVAVAEASVAWADTTVALRSATSRDASVCPAVTVWPTDTSTALTVPDTLKLRFAWLTGVIVPTEVEGGHHRPGPDRRGPVGGRRGAGQLPTDQGRDQHHDRQSDTEG